MPNTCPIRKVVGGVEEAQLSVLATSRQPSQHMAKFSTVHRRTSTQYGFGTRMLLFLAWCVFGPSAKQSDQALPS